MAKTDTEEETQAIIYVCDCLYKFSTDNFKWIKTTQEDCKLTGLHGEIKHFRAFNQDSVVTEETKVPLAIDSTLVHLLIVPIFVIFFPFCLSILSVIFLPKLSQLFPITFFLIP